MAAVKMARGVVARGRTVSAPHPTMKRHVRSEDGRPLEAPAMVDYGPGSEIELPVEEIERLRKAGFLIDTAQPEIAAGNGPVFRPSANETLRLESAPA